MTAHYAYANLSKFAALLTLQAITTLHEVTPPSPASGQNGTLPAISTVAHTNGHSTSPKTRKSDVSDTPAMRSAPPSSIDIVLRWLDEYAVESTNMPAEMAGNALSLLEGIVRGVPKPEVKRSLPSDRLKASLHAVTGRTSDGPHQKALQSAASGILKSLS